MGGLNETIVKSESVTKGAKAGNIRIHESAGSVHFHDDADKLKVAVPVHRWFAAWTNLRTTPGSTWSYYDPDTGCMLHVGTTEKRPEILSFLYLTAVTTDELFATIDKFTNG